MNIKLRKIKIERYPNYLIDANGFVYSTIPWRGFKKIRKLKSHPNNLGYHRVTLINNGKRKTEFIHNLMCEIFIGNKNGLQIRHLDGNKENNSLSNLKLGTAKENAIDRDKHGRTMKGQMLSDIICVRKENWRLKKQLALFYKINYELSESTNILKVILELIPGAERKKIIQEQIETNEKVIKEATE